MLDRDSSSGQSALYFEGSTHGSPLTLGGMICGWPKASYPTSEADESRVLESVRSTVKSAATPVSAIVVEPTQQSSGYSVSDKFIQELYSIARENDAALVVDETSSSCHATGNFWQYKGPADFVTFGRRAQATGYFSKSEGLTALGGSENDVKLLKLILDGVQKDGLDARSRMWLHTSILKPLIFLSVELLEQDQVEIAFGSTLIT